jgi:hypothetical protein
MLTPTMGYEAGKGRALELERKLAARRQLEEALAVQRLEQPSLLERLVERLKKVVAPGATGNDRLPGFDLTRGQRPQPTAP